MLEEMIKIVEEHEREVKELEEKKKNNPNIIYDIDTSSMYKSNMREFNL